MKSVRGPLFPAAQYGADERPSSLAIADLDRDGRLDLVVAISDCVRMLLNQGEFLPADVDGDSDVDLADLAALLANYGEGTRCPLRR